MPHLLISSDSLDGFCTERHFLARSGSATSGIAQKKNAGLKPGAYIDSHLPKTQPGGCAAVYWGCVEAKATPDSWIVSMSVRRFSHSSSVRP